MKLFVNFLFVAIIIALLNMNTGLAQTSGSSDLSWPQSNRFSRPWSYWWWHGSAVTKSDLQSLMTQYKSVELGGLHIVPIYGVQNNSANNIPFLSQQWKERLIDSVQFANANDMGIDMTMGTGWMWGGPLVTTNYSSRRTGGTENFKVYPVSAGGSLSLTNVDGRIESISVRNESSGMVQDISNQVVNNSFSFTAPAGTANYKVFVLLSRPTMSTVKRAAPGGAGLMIDPYSNAALNTYWTQFANFFDGIPVQDRPRSLYHDSFEYYGDHLNNSQSGYANIGKNFASEFQQRRGYSFALILPSLMKHDTNADRVSRAFNDYRQTLSEMHLDFIRNWTNLAGSKNMITRNQAHGSPTNVLDTYAAATIPETENYRGGQEGETDPLLLKMASSAGNVMGKPLISAESATWLGEHFKVTPQQIKYEMDRILSHGVNHLVYHGIAYSPAAEAWPGRLFYAETNFGQSNTFWKDFKEFNQYITRIQSVLQSGKPENDILLYYPLNDIWHNDVSKLTIHLGAHSLSELIGTSNFYSTAKELTDRGYGFDMISDLQIQSLNFVNGKIKSPGNEYRIILVPKISRMPLSTLQKLSALAGTGARVIFINDLPSKSPGFMDKDSDLSAIKSSLAWQNGLGAQANVSKAIIGSGHFIKSPSLVSTLVYENIPVESFSNAQSGLKTVRRRHSEGHHYFVFNSTNAHFEGEITLSVPFQSLLFMDPLFANKIGIPETKLDSSGKVKIRLQLKAGETVIIRTFNNKVVSASNWKYTGAVHPTLQTLILEPLSITASCSSAYAGSPGQDRSCNRIVDRSGSEINGLGTHDTSPYAKMWLSSGTSLFPQSIRFDLKQKCTVNAIRVWNYNERTVTGVPLTNRGAKNISLLGSVDGSNYSLIGPFVLAQAPGSSLIDFSQIISLSTAPVQFLKMEITSNWGDLQYVGLSEVEIDYTDCVPNSDIGQITVSSATCFSTYKTPISQTNGGDRACSRMIDGSGLVSTNSSAHSNSPYGTMWLNDGSAVQNQFVVLNLGKKCDIDRLKVFNYNEKTTFGLDLSGRGIKMAEILLSNDGVNYVSKGSFLFNRASAEANANIAQNISIQGLNTQYIKIKAQSNWNETIANSLYHSTGLSEVQVFGGNCNTQVGERNKTPWKVQFISGGPTLPPTFFANKLASWTKIGPSEAYYFAGTASYETTFQLQQLSGDDMLLDLGVVRETAKVFVNGTYVSTLFRAPYVIQIGDYLNVGTNSLRIEVSNLPTNRIIKMDIDNVFWKKFEEINYISITGQPFNAAFWPVVDSGLIGPVKLIPLTNSP